MDYGSYDQVLSEAMEQSRRIYSAAYIMPSEELKGRANIRFTSECSKR